MEKKSNRKLLPYEAGMSIHERLHEIMVALEYLQKTHEVKFDKTNYRATTEEYVLKAIRPLIVEYHILVVAVGIQNEFFKNKSGNNVTHTVVTYRWSCVNSPDSFIETVSQGQGCDSQDKGAGTAFTYSGKYNLLKNLLIATGDDPDYVSSAEKDAVDEAEKEAFTTLLKLVKTNLDALIKQGKIDPTKYQQFSALLAEAESETNMERLRKADRVFNDLLNG